MSSNNQQATALKVEERDEKLEAQAPVENRRILVVEDEPEIAKSYESILSGGADNVIPMRRSSRSQAPAEPVQNNVQGFEVVVVHQAIKALETVKQAVADGKPFAMGFFDVLLGPGMDGIELVRQIHEFDPNMFAVFVTAYNDRNVDSIRKLLGESMSDKWDYLNKPFSEGEILQKARNTVALWNLRNEKQAQDTALAEANRRLHIGERMASVAAVARGVGHEFGNILTQIIGQAELGRMGNEQRMKQALDTILKATETASAILERFKDLAKGSESVSKKKMIWAHSPLIEALELMGHQIKTTDIKIVRVKSERVQIMASHSSLVQVFVNIIINSIHAMGGPGQIDFSLFKDGDFVEYHIRDYGPGIPEELLGKVTQAFFTTKGDKGTGLGLSICKEIVEIEHRGQFTVKNHPMKGAEMVIRIPVMSEDD
ncbi:MAG TPA: ATP-binding protein [Bdellovibrionales bacterium]|nr:ATP-binding protein [Bdellovibrionales bacterium]